MGLWQRAKQSWMEEYNRPTDICNVPCLLAWLLSLTLLGLAWWRIGLGATIKGYWWAVPIALLVIWLCDLLGDWLRKRK